MRRLVAKPSQDGVQRPKSAKVVVRAMRCMSFSGTPGAIAGPDQGSDAGSRDDIDGDAGVLERADYTDMGDAAGKTACQGQTDAGAFAGGAVSPLAKARNLSLAFLSQSTALVTLSSSIFLHFSASRGCVGTLFDPGMLVL